jgi:hypothetical protein
MAEGNRSDEFYSLSAHLEVAESNEALLKIISRIATETTNAENPRSYSVANDGRMDPIAFKFI